MNAGAVAESVGSKAPDLEIGSQQLPLVIYHLEYCK